ncbi:exonuclease domain-containing protein [Photobacterium kishitanii]|uniref:Exonuclease domain-containing protein n=1 Tax=Photobacterium kishitanii TaxID=318456 RepID=A0A2T3KMZ0_9GAMM|nr:exonuclease domain-containing protein [Photobacterium kishitanii]PSV01148.1 hypothetical protein C9J27_03755 [Photobacterium kishitanii]
MNFKAPNFLNITPANKISEWCEIIHCTLDSGKDVYYIGDIETTGLRPDGDKNNKDLKDRALEIAFLCYIQNDNGVFEELKDISGNHIFFHEYINPFAEELSEKNRYRSIDYIPNEARSVHGISKEFLDGLKGLEDSNGEETNFKLKQKAPTFAQIKPILDLYFYTSNVSINAGRRIFTAHNGGDFDAKFLSSEWHKAELYHENHLQPARFESFVDILDTLSLIKDMYKSSRELSIAYSNNVNFDESVKVNYKLDFLKIFYNHENIERDVHGAMIDSYLLAKVFFSMLSDNSYLNMPLVKKHSNIQKNFEILDTKEIRLL